MTHILRSSLTLLAGFALTIGVVACGSGPAPSAPPAGSHAMTHPLIVPTKSGHPDAVYQPNPIRVHLGQTIVWTNNDPDDPHTVTSTDYLFDSGDIASGATWSWRPVRTGTYHYYCTLHPEMKGVIIVTR